MNKRFRDDDEDRRAAKLDEDRRWRQRSRREYRRSPSPKPRRVISREEDHRRKHTSEDELRAKAKQQAPRRFDEDEGIGKNPARHFTRVEALLPVAEGNNKRRRSYAEVIRGKSTVDGEKGARRRSHSPVEELRPTKEDDAGEWVLVRPRKTRKAIQIHSSSENSRIDGRLNCHKCAKPGHTISKCNSDWFCYYCRHSGHISSACPKRIRNVSANSKVSKIGIASASGESKTQESIAGDRHVIQASIAPTPLIAEFERRFNGGIIVKAQTGVPTANDVSELLQAALVATPPPIWVIQEAAVDTFYAHCSDAAVAKEAIRIKGLEGKDSHGLEFFVTFKWWSREFGAMKPEAYPAVWLRLYNLPYHCWVRSGFQNIVRQFGLLIDVDRQTLTLSARKFARIKVGVANKAAIPSKIIVEFDNVSYEVTVIVESQKNVSFRDLSNPVRIKSSGGDFRLEEEETIQPFDEKRSNHIRPPQQLEQRAQEKKERQFQTQLDRTINLSHPPISPVLSDSNIANWKWTPKHKPAADSTLLCRLDGSTVEAKMACGSKSSFGEVIGESVGQSSKSNNRLGILKQAIGIGFGHIKSMGILNEEWLKFSQEEIDLSIKAAMAGLVQSKALVDSTPSQIAIEPIGPERNQQFSENCLGLQPCSSPIPINIQDRTSAAQQSLQLAPEQESEDRIIGALH